MNFKSGDIVLYLTDFTDLVIRTDGRHVYLTSLCGTPIGEETPRDSRNYSIELVTDIFRGCF